MTGRYYIMRFFLIFLIYSLCALIAFGSSYGLISDACERGDISIYDKALLQAMLILDYESVPAEYKTKNPCERSFMCATGLIKEAESILRSAPAEYILRYKSVRSRPGYSNKVYRYLSGQGHFYIHYTVKGEHAVDTADDNTNGIPDKVELMAEYFEYSHDIYHSQLGYILPPSDGEAGGGIDIYDVYIENYPEYYGYTMPEYYSGDMPDYSTRTVSYIGISSWVTGDDLGATIAHEYYHACQMAYYCDYNAYSSWAWDENTAMYTEKIVFPEGNTWLAYTGYRQNRPFNGLWLFDGWTEYSNVIWPFFIREALVDYDDTFFRTVFEELGNSTTNNEGGFYPFIIDELLCSSAGMTLREAYQIFTQWNYLVKDCYDGSGYDDGEAFIRQPKPHQVLYYQDLPFSGTGDPNYSNEIPPESHASHYIEIYPEQAGPGALVAKIQGDLSKNQVWGYSILCHERQFPLTAGWTACSREISQKAGAMDILLPEPGLYDRVVLIIDNLQYMEEPESRNYSYSVSLHNDVQVSGIEPDSGHISGNEIVQISGANFDSGASVFFDKTPALMVDFINSREIIILTPPHSEGSVSITVSTMFHGSLRLYDAFLFYE